MPAPRTSRSSVLLLLATLAAVGEASSLVVGADGTVAAHTPHQASRQGASPGARTIDDTVALLGREVRPHALDESAAGDDLEDEKPDKAAGGDKMEGKRKKETDEKKGEDDSWVEVTKWPAAAGIAGLAVGMAAAAKCTK